MESIKEVDPQSGPYKAHLADCIVITHDGKLLLQKRTWGRWEGHINPFGGHVENGETPIQGMIRELHEELGAIIEEAHVVHIGSITESFTDHSEIVHVYIWRDEKNTITGCYEGETIQFDTADEALAHPKIMEYASWALKKCMESGASLEALKRRLF